MDAFATAAELGQRLNRSFTAGEMAWMTVLLEDASTYLRDDVIGLQVFPQSTSTFTAWPDGDRIDLPQAPVVSVTSVTRDGDAVKYHLRDNSIYLHDWTRAAECSVDVTFTYGYTSAPESLKRWACVLVSQALLPLEQKLGLTAGGLSSVALDDFKLAWADAGEESGITLSDRNIELIRSQFGVKSTFVVTTR